MLPMIRCADPVRRSGTPIRCATMRAGVDDAQCDERQSSCADLPVADVAASIARYERLRFKGRLYGGTEPRVRPIYGYFERQGVHFHLALTADLDPHRNMCAVYFYVDDPDALFRDWSAASHEGRLEPPEDREWGMRKITYTDPDGNLLRIGRLLT